MLALPSALAAYRQFVVYIPQPSRTRPGKTDKYPVHPVTGAWPVNAHDRTIWLDAPTAIATAATLGAGYGVGFVFTESDPFWFLDLDNALLPDNTWSPIAQQLLTVFAGAAVEISQSGRGIHIIGSGTAPAHGCKNATFDLEFYTEARFVALTGVQAQGDASRDYTAILPWLVSSYFPSTGSTAGASADWTTEPCAEWRGSTDDTVLIDRALRSHSARSAFGNAASFADLWTADVTVLTRAFPDVLRPYDESSADAALAQHLMFWTGRNCERTLRLMKQSALARAKWERDDYLPRTIGKALAQSVDVCQDRPVEAPASQVAPEDHGKPPAAKPVTGNTMLGLDGQITVFENYVYIEELDRVLSPEGYILTAPMFNTRFGKFSFVMDQANGKVSRKAYEVFTTSQLVEFPSVRSHVFEPNEPPGCILVREGKRSVNTYFPIATPRHAGDASKFYDHLSRMIPNERDRTLVLSYMAGIVQYKGYKFQWAPFIQGVEGNGKSTLNNCVAYAVGEDHVHYAKSAELTSRFNGWLYGTIFIAVEDVFVPENQVELLETLKPMITGKIQPIEFKGVDVVSKKICCNFMLNSNHKDGLRKTRNDRRLAVIYTAQQALEDLTTSGLTPQYFSDYYNWLEGEGKYAGHPPGYAVVSELLHTYAIPAEFGLDVLRSRAPETSSTDEAILAGLGQVEQEINESIEQGLPGFAGGWISSIMLDRLLDKLHASNRYPPNKRRALLKTLGYDWHPHLPQGRISNTIMYPDGGKPRLFVRTDSPLGLIAGGGEIARAYTVAQDSPLLTPATIKGNVIPIVTQR